MKGKVAVITGGNGTLGSAFSKGLAQAGAKVFILGRNEEKSAKRIAEFTEMGLQVEAVTCDVLDQVSVDNAVETVVKKAGRVDILINSAGGNLRGAIINPNQTIFDISIEDFKKVNDLNLLGTVMPTIAFAKPMVEQGSGCIINVSSMSSILPLTRIVGYSASKAAVDSFTRWMAVEMATKYDGKIRVNAIAPGFFIAKQNKKLLLKEDGTLTDRAATIINNTPMKRFGDPDDLISTILWLCDDRSSFVTGIVVPVDGGFSAFSGV